MPSQNKDIELIYYVYYRSNKEYVIDQLDHQIYPCIAKRLY